MGRRRRWRWRPGVPDSTCICFRRKTRPPHWQSIAAEDEDDEEALRRGGMSYDCADKTAVYVRTLADVKGSSGVDVSYTDTASSNSSCSRRSSLLHEADLRLLSKLDSSLYKTHWNLRFASLHKVRRKQRATISTVRFTKDNASILDTQYLAQAQCLLTTVHDWNFNIFTLDKLTNGRSLFHLSLHVFQEHRLLDHFNLDFIKLMRCIALVEEGYHSSNPYHNAVHAADVGQAMHCYLLENKVAQCLTPLEKLTAIFSAITHDLDHPGVNQAFLIVTSNPLAALYNNTSVLENHHWRSAMGVLHESGLLSHCSASTWSTIEWQLKSLILATDITRQQEFLSKFKGHLERNDLDLKANEDQRNLILQIALKCADICNPCRPWEISKRWSEAVCDEFFKQGDYERKLQLPVTPLLDRHSTTVAKIQIGFMQFVVLPLFNEWYRFNPSQLSKCMIDNVHANKANWEGIQREAQKAKDAANMPESVPEEEEDEEEVDVQVTGEESGESQPVEDVDTSTTMSSPVISSPAPTPDEDESTPEKRPMARRHSLPPPIFVKDMAFLTRRESFPRSNLRSRRHSLPVSTLNSSSSFDRLVDKLSALTEKSRHDNGSNFDFGENDPKGMNVMSVSLDTTALSSARCEADKQTSAHGLDPLLLAHRPFSSDVQTLHSSLAQAGRHHLHAGPSMHNAVTVHAVTPHYVAQQTDSTSVLANVDCCYDDGCLDTDNRQILVEVHNHSCKGVRASGAPSSNHHRKGRHNSVPLLSLSSFPSPLPRHSIATSTLCPDDTPLLSDVLQITREDATISLDLPTDVTC